MFQCRVTPRSEVGSRNPVLVHRLSKFRGRDPDEGRIERGRWAVQARGQKGSHLIPRHLRTLLHGSPRYLLELLVSNIGRVRISDPIPNAGFYHLKNCLLPGLPDFMAPFLWQLFLQQRHLG